MMDFNEAGKLTRDLMEEHGLLEQGWKWRWAKGIKVMGHCSHAKREIALYKPFTSMASEAEVRETILHEIAHALVKPKRDPYTRRWDHHGYEWKRMALSIGSNGQRCGVNPYYRQLKAAEYDNIVPIAAQSGTMFAAKPTEVAVGVRATVVLPSSRKWNGFTGVVVKETDKKFQIRNDAGEILSAPKSLVTVA